MWKVVYVVGKRTDDVKRRVSADQRRYAKFQCSVVAGRGGQELVFGLVINYFPYNQLILIALRYNQLLQLIAM